METKNLLNNELSRMEAFRLFSECYIVPDKGLSNSLDNLEGHLATMSEPAAKCVQRMRKEIAKDQNFEALKVDFAKLFVGPFTLLAAPYGSVYLDQGRTIMGDSTLDVKKRYREAGLDTSKDFNDVPDHITAELEFMYYLIFKEIEAFSDSDTETATGCIQKQRSFLEDHLMAWVPEFANSIKKNAEASFYPNLAKATEAFLKANHEILCLFPDSKKLNSEKHVEINCLLV